MSETHTDRGTLGIGDEGTFRIRFERRLPVPVDRAWAWLTEPALLERWLPGCRVAADVGSAVLFDFGDEGAATGVVTAVEVPGETGMLVHSWEWEGVPRSMVT